MFSKLHIFQGFAKKQVLQNPETSAVYFYLLKVCDGRLFVNFVALIEEAN